MNIVTNNHYRQLISWDDLTPKEQEDFDFSDKKQSDYFRYKGIVYTLADFCHISFPVSCKTGEKPFEGWDSWHNDSFFSGILIKISDCGEMVKCGWFYS